MKTVKLGQVAEVIAGQSPEGAFYNSVGNGIPFYQGKKEFSTKYLGEPTTWTTKVTKVAAPGDILMSVRAPVGPINFATEEICIGRGLAAIRAMEEIDRDFLFYFLLFQQPKIARNTGAVFDSINKDQIAGIELIIPSLPEQKTIVEKLDAAFAEIDQLEANLETKSRYTNELLNSILGSTFSGDDADPKPHQGPAVKIVKLGQVAEVIAGQSPEGVFYNSVGNGIPFYQGKKEFGTKYLGKPTTWTTKVTKLARQGDILMSVRAPVGPINFSTDEICIGRGLAAIRGNKEIDNDFLFYFLLFKQPDLVGNAGAVFDSINKDQIAGIELLLPSLPEQKAIVEKLDAAFAEIDKLRERTKQAKESFSALRQSILSSVFTEKSDAA